MLTLEIPCSLPIRVSNITVYRTGTGSGADPWRYSTTRDLSFYSDARGGSFNFSVRAGDVLWDSNLWSRTAQVEYAVQYGSSSNLTALYQNAVATYGPLSNVRLVCNIGRESYVAELETLGSPSGLLVGDNATYSINDAQRELYLEDSSTIVDNLSITSTGAINSSSAAYFTFGIGSAYWGRVSETGDYQQRIDGSGTGVTFQLLADYAPAVTNSITDIRYSGSALAGSPGSVIIDYTHSQKNAFQIYLTGAFSGSVSYSAAEAASMPSTGTVSFPVTRQGKIARSDADDYSRFGAVMTVDGIIKSNASGAATRGVINPGWNISPSTITAGDSAVVGISCYPHYPQAVVPPLSLAPVYYGGSTVVTSLNSITGNAATESVSMSYAVTATSVTTGGTITMPFVYADHIFGTFDYNPYVTVDASTPTVVPEITSFAILSSTVTYSQSGTNTIDPNARWRCDASANVPISGSDIYRLEISDLTSRDSSTSPAYDSNSPLNELPFIQDGTVSDLRIPNAVSVTYPNAYSAQISIQHSLAGANMGSTGIKVSLVSGYGALKRTYATVSQSKVWPDNIQTGKGTIKSVYLSNPVDVSDVLNPVVLDRKNPIWPKGGTIQVNPTTGSPTDGAASTGRLTFNSANVSAKFSTDGGVTWSNVISNTTDLALGTGTPRLQLTHIGSTSQTTAEVTLDATGPSGKLYTPRRVVFNLGDAVTDTAFNKSALASSM